MKRSLALVAVAALAVAGCSSDGDDAESTTTSAPVETTDGGSDSSSPPTSGTSTTSEEGGEVYEVSGDTTIEATAGSTFTIALEANETTGYRWAESVDGDAVVSKGGRYEAEATDRVGSGGTQLYDYEAVAAGTATIALTYSQVGSEDVGQSYTVTVDVS